MSHKFCIARRASPKGVTAERSELLEFPGRVTMPRWLETLPHKRSRRRCFECFGGKWLLDVRELYMDSVCIYGTLFVGVKILND